MIYISIIISSIAVGNRLYLQGNVTSIQEVSFLITTEYRAAALFLEQSHIVLWWRWWGAVVPKYGDIFSL